VGALGKLGVPPEPPDLSPISMPPDPGKLRPVERVPRDHFGEVGEFPLNFHDLDALVYPTADKNERRAALEGLRFFTTPHTAVEGLGPIANQQMCLGCHMNSDEVLERDAAGNRLLTKVSQVSRAGRATPTNFDFVGFDPITGGGRAADHLNALTDTGKTAAFTVFGDFSPSTQMFDGLTQFAQNSTQHTRPSLKACLADPLPPFSEDPNLQTGVDPKTHLSASGFRRAVGERAGPPYIGRGLIEAVADEDILKLEAEEKNSNWSSLERRQRFPECNGDCIAGRHNENTSDRAFNGGAPEMRVGKFGVRAGGPTMMQFIVGGVQGELGFTSVLLNEELLSPVNDNRPGCANTVPSPQVPVSTPLSIRTLLRLTAPPEFGEPLLHVLNSEDPEAPFAAGTIEERVQRGAKLFGVDLIAFANRMIPGRMPTGGDGRDEHAVDRRDRLVGCAGCHTPVIATGQLPNEAGTSHISNVWAPLFSDLLIHEGPSVEPERIVEKPRVPLFVLREDRRGRVRAAFDLPRSLTDDALPHQNSGIANGREFRTAPLMGIGRIGPPFLHDGRVYLNKESVHLSPASTVYSNSEAVNQPLVVKTLDDALLAAIELHDLPAPFTANHQSRRRGGGCPVPANRRAGDIAYTSAQDICPPYDSELSKENRSDSREIIRRFRSLSADDQQAIIDFLKQL
jgi:Di-haem oxidoreductase, putative peroxidase